MARPTLKHVNFIVSALHTAAQAYVDSRNAIAEERKRLPINQLGSPLTADIAVRAAGLKRLEDQFYRQWEEARALAELIEEGAVVLQ